MRAHAKAKAGIVVWNVGTAVAFSARRSADATAIYTSKPEGKT
jgi:hypothetical protein